MKPLNSKKHPLSKQEKEAIIETIVSLIKTVSDNIAWVYLFGSFIDEGVFSDIDLGVVTVTDVKKPLDDELNLESGLERKINYPVDVRILNKAPISFTQNVIRKGRVIMESDPTRRADFESNVLKQYFDFAYFRDQYLKEVVNAPV